MPQLLTPNGMREGGVRATYSRGIIDREEDWHYVVQADDKFQARSHILFATPGLPIIGNTIMDGMLCIGGDANRDPDHALRWNVNLTFSTSIDQDDAQVQNQGDPTLWTPVRRTMWEVKEKMMTKDASGTRVANSAGQPFDVGIMRRRHIPAWEFVQWEPISVTDEMLMDRMEVVNSGVWKTKPAKTWLCRVMDSVVGFYAGYRCRMTTYRVIYDPEKWTHKRLDTGYVYKSGSNLLPYTDKAGNVINGPLNGSGAKQTVGTPPAELEFDDYTTSDFSFLRV